MEKRIGFIGCGKMAQAMISGLLRSKIVLPEQIIASARTIITLNKVKATLGIDVTEDNQKVVKHADFLVLAIKPNIYPIIIEEIRSSLHKDTVVITIAAGIDLFKIEQLFEKEVKVVRTMPNTPSQVGEGMTAISFNQYVTKEELEDVSLLFQSIGKVELIQESLMDAVPAISGSSPAYVYMFIEALADGAVLQGFTREQAYHMAAQAVLGAAKMVLETGVHPAELKDQVCTPGGATIEAVAELERNHFRAAVINAMEICTHKTKVLSNPHHT